MRSYDYQNLFCPTVYEHGGRQEGMGTVSVRNLIAADFCEWKRIGYLGPNAAIAPLRLREALTLFWRFAGLRATVNYRLSHAASMRNIPLVPMVLFRRNMRKYGLDIMPAVSIGPGLYIPHPVGTVVMAHSIGSRCHIISSVTIGMRNTPAFPVIGDDVTIGAGARVLGDIRIGNGAQIGANAVVVDHIPDGATAVGIPARIVKHTAPALAHLGQTSSPVSPVMNSWSSHYP